DDSTPTPAFDGACARDRARVRPAGRDRLDSPRKAGNADRSQTAIGRAVPELTEAGVAPALDAARGRERTGVVAAGRDRADAASKAEDADRGRAVGGRAVADPTDFVVAPALDRARACHCAGVRPAGRDGAHAARKAEGADRGRAADGRAVPELTVLVVAPALDRPRACHCAGVEAAGRDRADTALKAGDLDRGLADVPSGAVP